MTRLEKMVAQLERQITEEKGACIRAKARHYENGYKRLQQPLRWLADDASRRLWKEAPGTTAAYPGGLYVAWWIAQAGITRYWEDVRYNGGHPDYHAITLRNLCTYPCYYGHDKPHLVVTYNQQAVYKHRIYGVLKPGHWEACLATEPPVLYVQGEWEEVLRVLPISFRIQTLTQRAKGTSVEGDTHDFARAAQTLGLAFTIKEATHL